MEQKQGTNKDIHKALLQHFKAHQDYKTEDYYTFSLMQLKRNRKWSIKLVYDYVGGNSKTSSAIVVDSMEEAFDICRILQEFSKDKSEAPKGVSLSEIQSKISSFDDEPKW